jgi:2-aminoadipate transaminase
MDKKQKRPGLLDLWEKFIQASSSKPGIISFASGRPRSDLYIFHYSKLKKILEKISRQKGEQIFGYSPPPGIPKLRQIIAKWHQVDENEIIITAGAQQAIDLVAKTILKPGRVVLLEEKNYVGFEIPIENQGAKIAAVPCLNEISEQNLEKMIKAQRPTLCYVSPDFANPTGETLSLATRRKIIKLCKKYKVSILEDQTYRELVYEEKNQLPSLKDLDRNVLAIGTVSKTIVPGLRIGWLMANEKLYPKLLWQKRAADLCTPIINQMAIAEFLRDNYFLNRYLSQLRKCYQEKMLVLIKSLEKHMPKSFSWNKPRGGIFVWVKGPKTLNSEKLFMPAISNGVAFVPGFVFDYHPSSRPNTFRLSTAPVIKNEIEEGIKRLSATIRGEKVKWSPPRRTILSKVKGKIERLLQTQPSV